MAADVVDIFRREIPVDLMRPPQTLAHWGLRRLTPKYDVMDNILRVVSANVESYSKDYLIELEGHGSLVSGLGDRLKIGIVTVPLHNVIDGGSPELEELQQEFARLRRERSMGPNAVLNAVLIEDVVQSGNAAHALAEELWRDSRVRLIHVASLIEDLRMQGRELINSPIAVPRRAPIKGPSYSTVVRFDPDRGFIEGMTTEGVSPEEAPHSAIAVGQAGYQAVRRRLRHLPTASKPHPGARRSKHMLPQLGF